MEMSFTKKQADWFYWSFYNNVLHCPYGRGAGFVYEYVDGQRTQDPQTKSKRTVLCNVQRMTRGGDIIKAQDLLDTVFSVRG